MSNFKQPNLSAKLKKGQTYEEVFAKKNWAEGFYSSPKLDGIRILMHPELGPVTRTLKPIPNRALQAKCERLMPYLSGFDGEMIYGDHESPNYSFQKTFSKFSSHDEDTEGMTFHVFDDMSDLTNNFISRFSLYNYRIRDILPSLTIEDSGLTGFVKAVSQTIVYTLEEVYEEEKRCLELGYEGTMLRHCDGLYKQGRSTMIEGGLIALKRFVDAEAIIIGFEEMMHNDNEALVDERGYTKRSSSLAGKTPANTLGKLWLKGHESSPFNGKKFKCGSGFSAALKQEIWDNQDKFLGKMITYKYQEHGVKDLPRAPIFKSFREDL